MEELGKTNSRRKQNLIKFQIYNTAQSEIGLKQSTRPGTVKAYLSSVGKFLKFIIQKVADETNEFPSIDERSLRLANNVLNRLPDWRTAISRKFSHKKWERVLEVSRWMPPASTINDLMSTEPAKEAITILNKSSTGHLVSSREFIFVRDFLIVRLELENAHGS